MRVIILILSLSSFSAFAQDINIPPDGCQWRGADYGSMNDCEGNEVPRGSCGSGRDADCSGDYHQLLCCDLQDYHYEDCIDYNGDYGEDLSCLEHDTTLIVEGACGSGRDPDCDGHYHKIRCCHGKFSNGTAVVAKGLEFCYWLYADYGDQIECNQHDEAVFGRCGSGRDPDCGEGVYHGIECCRLTMRA